MAKRWAPFLSQFVITENISVNGINAVVQTTRLASILKAAMYFGMSVGMFQRGPDAGKPFINLRLGFGRFWDGKWKRRPLQIFVSIPEAMQYILDMGLNRGDLLNLIVERTHEVPGGFEGKTKAFCASRLLVKDGVPAIQYVGHREIKPLPDRLSWAETEPELQ